MSGLPQTEIGQYYACVLMLSKEDGGGVLVYYPDLPGCLATGETLADAAMNAKDAAEGWIEISKKYGEKLPNPTQNPNIEWATEKGTMTIKDGSKFNVHTNPAPLTEKEKTELTKVHMDNFLGI